MRQMMAAAAAVAVALPGAGAGQVFGPAALPVATDGAERPAPLAPEIVTIPAATEIWLTPLHEISSKYVRTGDLITLSVVRNVYVHRTLVIPRRTEALGRISYRTGKGTLGKSAKIEFDLTSLTLDHRPVPIAGHYRVAGRGNSGWTVATFVFVSMLGSFFITGHSAVVPAGSEWRALTARPLQIAFDRHAPIAGAMLRNASFRPEPGSAAGERELPANSAYVAPPAEIFVKTLPPR